MTTLWARLKIYETYKSGEITEECAKYFDELLHYNMFNIDLEEILNFNSKDWCVLKRIAYNNEFDIMKYIKKTSFKNGYTIGDKTVYLANLINEDFLGLCSYISYELSADNLDRLQMILDYLEATNYKAVPPHQMEHLKLCLLNNIKRLQGKEKSFNFDSPTFNN